MGGCASQAPGKVVVPKEAKRHDVFISHHHGFEAEEDTRKPSQDFSLHFASWISEVCDALQLSVRLDTTNLSRLLDEKRLKSDIAAARVVVGVLSKEGLLDANGMHQELLWADMASVPVVPFYDGDRTAPEEYDVWKHEFTFLKRAPVVYHRRTHMRVKDSLVVALQEAIQESYQLSGVHMPPALSELLDTQAARAQKRQQRVGRAREPVPKDSDEDEAEEKKTVKSTSPASEKRFRFRDEEVDDETSPTGVTRFLKTLKDPMGWKEQEMRTALLQDEHEAGAEEGRHEPQHHRLKPGGGILKGNNEGAVSPNRTMSAAAQMTVDPKMQQGVGRVQEYLASVKKEDVKQLPTVLKILQLMLPNLEVATGALALIFEFVRDVAESRQIVSQLKGIKEIVKAMTSHSNSVELQTHGCGCLYALSCFRADNPEKDNNSVAIAHAGGIGRILHAMDAFPTCEEIQQWGTGSLRHLAIEIGGNRREVMEGGEIQLTMRGINRRMITKSGGIELLVQSMLRFPDDLEIQENGCAALCNLMANRHDTKVRAARSGCIRAVIAALRNFPFEPELAQMACAVLRSLALGVPENKISIVAQGGIRQLCEAMARHREDAEVNMQAVAALCNLTAQLAENKRAICEAGGLEMAVAALMTHPQSQELQQQGCGLLHNLACDPVLRPQVNAAGGLQVAAAAMQHPARAVQSLGTMLQRQLQARQDPSPEAAQESPKTMASPAKDKDGGVDELFAPRTHSVRVARSKALTRPQRKVMADVMASMQRNPREWLPREGTTGSSASGDETSKASEASSASGGGRWTLREQQRAASYGIEDLEGVSDMSSEDGGQVRKGYGGAFAFVIRRGLDKQGSGEIREPSPTKASRSEEQPRPQEAKDPQPALSHLDLDLESPKSATPKGQPAFFPLTEQNLRRASYETPGAPANADQRGQVSFAADAKEADADQALDTRSQASSDQSEGGWIDDLEDPRLDKRARKQRRQLTKSSGASSGILEEVFGEVELEVERPKKQPRIPKPASRDFARALRKCGEAAPERVASAWDDAVSARSRSRKGGSPLSVLNELDGLAKYARLPSMDVRKNLAGVKTLAGKVATLGQKRSFDEEAEESQSIYAGDDVQDVGKAEVALLGVLGEAQSKSAKPRPGQPAAPAEAGNPTTDLRLREAKRLEALSRRLDQRRAQTRRVQLL